MQTDFDTTKELNMQWTRVLGILETQLNPVTFKTVFSKSHISELKKDTVTIAVISKFALSQAKKFISLVESAIERVFGKNYQLAFALDEPTLAQSEPKKLGPLFEPPIEEPVSESVLHKSGLSLNFTFENYIMGNSNQLAFAIAQAISEKPGKTYNPFFLYSGVGLGKTHLVQAIGNKILQKNARLTVVYTTGEAFTNEMIEAIQSAKGRGKYLINEFRNKFRKADVLIIDDVQFIVGRDSTQQEFFHTFNALHMAGKQIILTSDRPPKDFVNLEKRISSRFGSGIIADIQAPDLDMKNAILRHKRSINKDAVSNEIIDYIAQKVQTNIRELEGAYTQVLTELRTKGLTPTKDLVDAVLGKNIEVARKKVVNMNDILKIVCKYYAVTALDVKGKTRTKDLVIPRHVSMFLMKELTEMPLIGIGKFLGGRDHTTVMHAVEKVEKELNLQGKTRQDVSNIKALL